MQALSIGGLRKVYNNGIVALKGIDLTVNQGDFFALLGPNGAGKSTTIGIISSLINKTAGTVKVFGYDLDDNLEQAKACIGLVPQELNLNPFEKVIDSLVYQAGYYGISSKIAKTRAEIYLRKLDLWTKREQPCMRLSGGMKRRLMIVRALLHEPPLLILDEPTAGVDVEIRRAMWEFLSEINRNGTSIILTTHYLEETETLCKNIAIIDKGSIIENTSVKKLLLKLGSHTLVLDVQQSLHSVPSSQFPMRLLDSHTLEVDIDRQQTLNQLFEWLQAQAITVVSVRNKTNRLEALFLRLIATSEVRPQTA